MLNVEHPPMHPSHQRIWELLPWYLNDTLETAEYAEVRRHVGSCLVCHREIRRLEQLELAVSAPLAEQASAQAFARLSRQINAARATPRWRQKLVQALAGLFEPVPLIAGASLLVVSSILVATIVVSGNHGPSYGEQPFQTLGHKRVMASEISHPTVRVVLREDPGDSGLAAWLERHAAELVDGPTAIGVLTVRVAIGQRSYATLLAEIRADQETLFVEPVGSVGSRPDRHR
jgi:anti-sigma factor RsiW